MAGMSGAPPKGNQMGELHLASKPEPSRHDHGHLPCGQARFAGDPAVVSRGRLKYPGAVRADLPYLQRTAGNAAVTRFIGGLGHASPGSIYVARQITPVPGEAYAPREAPLRAPATVSRARKLKIEVDQQTEPLVASALQLSEVATPIIEQFTAAHEVSLDSLRTILRPWLPESAIDWGTVLQFAIGLTLLPVPAKGFYAVAKELAIESTQTVAGGRVSEAQEAMEAARKGMIMAEWLQGTHLASEAAAKARSVVRQNYDTAAKLQLAVLRPWNDLMRAEAAGDQVGVLESAAQFVQVAPTYSREAKRAADASRALVVSYLIAALNNSSRAELHRKMAVVLPDVMQGLRDRKGVLGMQGSDDRASFIEKVLVHFFAEVQPRSMAHWSQSRHSIADIYRRGSSLFPRRGTGAHPGPVPTLEYAGTELGEYQGFPPFHRIHAIAEEKEQVSLPSVEVAVERNSPWVMEPSVVINHWTPRLPHEQIAIALGAADRHADQAREHWGRIAGVVP
jgi:hypothetical protein